MAQTGFSFGWGTAPLFFLSSFLPSPPSFPPHPPFFPLPFSPSLPLSFCPIVPFPALSTAIAGLWLGERCELSQRVRAEVPGLFVPWTIRTLDCSYHGLFVPLLDDSYHVAKGNIVYTIQCESKKIPLRFSDIFFQNGWEFSVQILRAYCTFIPTVDYKFLSKYLQL